VVVEAECASGSRVRVNIQPVVGRNAESAWIHKVDQSLNIKIPASPMSDVPGALEHWRGNSVVASRPDGASDASERMGILGETEAFLQAVRSGGGFAPCLPDCRVQVALDGGDPPSPNRSDPLCDGLRPTTMEAV